MLQSGNELNLKIKLVKNRTPGGQKFWVSDFFGTIFRALFTSRGEEG